MIKKTPTLICMILFIMATVLWGCKTTENVPFIPGGQNLNDGGGGSPPPPGGRGTDFGNLFEDGGAQKDCTLVDNDGDGYDVCTGTDCECVNPNPSDCNDENPARHPDAKDIAGDGVDQNCDGEDGVVEGEDGNGDGKGKGKGKGSAWASKGAIAGYVIGGLVVGGATAYFIAQANNYTLDHCTDWYQKFQKEYYSKRTNDDLVFTEKKRWYWWDPDLQDMCNIIEKLVNCETDNDIDGAYRESKQFVKHVEGSEKTNLKHTSYKKVAAKNCSKYTKEKLAETGSCYQRYNHYLNTKPNRTEKDCTLLAELVICTNQELRTRFWEGVISDTLYGKGNTLDKFVSDVLSEENSRKKKATVTTINEINFYVDHSNLKCDDFIADQVNSEIDSANSLKDLEKIFTQPRYILNGEKRREMLDNFEKKTKELETLKLTPPAPSAAITPDIGKELDTLEVANRDLEKLIIEAKTSFDLQPLLPRFDGFKKGLQEIKDKGISNSRFDVFDDSIQRIENSLQTKTAYLILAPEKVDQSKFKILTCFDNPEFKHCSYADSNLSDKELAYGKVLNTAWFTPDGKVQSSCTTGCKSFAEMIKDPPSLAILKGILQNAVNKKAIRIVK